MSLRIAITGPEGLVGSRIIKLLKNDFDFILLPSREMDITNWDSVQKKFEGIDCDFILHLAAYTNVDGAETKPEKAFAVNVTGTQNIYKISKLQNIKSIHVSTDFVFDGTNPPYDEDSPTNPLGVYAKTKWQAEQVFILESKVESRKLKVEDVKAANRLQATSYKLQANVMIVRITYPYRLDDYPKKDFVRTIKWLLEQNREIAGITDCLITPTYIDDVAMALKHLVHNFSNEIFHVVGSKSISPYDAFQLIAKHWKLDQNLIKKATFEQCFAGKAPRPRLGQTISKKNTFHPMSSVMDVLRKQYLLQNKS